MAKKRYSNRHCKNLQSGLTNIGLIAGYVKGPRINVDMTPTRLCDYLFMSRHKMKKYLEDTSLKRSDIIDYYHETFLALTPQVNRVKPDEPKASRCATQIYPLIPTWFNL